jgi:hypothetical protein
VETADIDCPALEHERGALTGGLVTPRSKLVEELLMAIYWARRKSRPELVFEKNGRAQVGIVSRPDVRH